MKILFALRMVEYIDPMNIELLSALAKREGHSTYLSILAQDDLMTDLKRINPDIVAFSTMTGEVTYYIQAAQLVKKYSPNISTIIGGPHCTFFPEIIEEECFDAVGLGECDNAWPNFLRALGRGDNIHNIKNILTKENWYSRFKIRHKQDDFPIIQDGANTQYINCPEGKYLYLREHLERRLANLDGLPFLDRELIYSKTHLAEFPMRSFMSSRGCPFECTYCFEPRFNEIYRGMGPIFNRYSVKRLCEELKELKERWPTQFIKFYDDLFFIKRAVDPWLEEFAEIYPREVGLPFFCLTRCNILTEEILKLLIKAGLHSLTMSIEAGNDYVRNHIIKRHMTREEILYAFDLCRKHKVVTFANSIFGIPVKKEIMEQHGKTPIDYDIESLKLNIECGATFGEFGCIYPYPGCELTEYVIRNGWFSKEDLQSLHISYQSESPLNCFTPKEKMMQNNLALLGTVCVAFPWLTNIAVKYLIKLPLTKLYFILYYISKGYLNIFKVYPMKFTITNLIKNIIRSLRIEWKKRAPGKRLYRKPKIRKSTTTKMLGGLPKI